MWNKLSMKDKAEFIKTAVKNKIYNINNILDLYNRFAEGGNLFEDGTLKAIDDINSYAINNPAGVFDEGFANQRLYITADTWNKISQSLSDSQADALYKRGLLPSSVYQQHFNRQVNRSTTEAAKKVGITLGAAALPTAGAMVGNGALVGAGKTTINGLKFLGKASDPITYYSLVGKGALNTTAGLTGAGGTLFLDALGILDIPNNIKDGDYINAALNTFTAFPYAKGIYDIGVSLSPFLILKRSSQVSSLPEGYAYRRMTGQEVGDIIDNGVLREIPEDKLRPTKGSSLGITLRGKAKGNSHGGKGFAKDVDWAAVGSTSQGNLYPGEGVYIVGFPGEGTLFRVGHHASYSDPVPFENIEKGSPLFLPFNEAKNIPTQRMKIYEVGKTAEGNTVYTRIRDKSKIKRGDTSK